MKLRFGLKQNEERLLCCLFLVKDMMSHNWIPHIWWLYAEKNLLMDSFTHTLTGADPRLNLSSKFVTAVLLSLRVSASCVVFLPVLNMHSSLAFSWNILHVKLNSSCIITYDKGAHANWTGNLDMGSHPRLTYGSKVSQNKTDNSTNKL